MIALRSSIERTRATSALRIAFWTYINLKLTWLTMEKRFIVWLIESKAVKMPDLVCFLRQGSILSIDEINNKTYCVIARSIPWHHFRKRPTQPWLVLVQYNIQSRLQTLIINKTTIPRWSSNIRLLMREIPSSGHAFVAPAVCAGIFSTFFSKTFSKYFRTSFFDDVGPSAASP